MKIEGKTIPAPQNIKRREAYLINNADKLPSTYVQAQLLKIAITRSQKKLRWDVPDTRLKTMDERMNKPTEEFKVEDVKQTPKTFFGRVKGMFKERGN